MRAAAFLEVFRTFYDITLVVLAVYDQDLRAASRYADRVIAITPAELEQWLDRGGDMPLGMPHDFDRIHVFRLIAAPLVDRYLSEAVGRRPHCTIDLDDYESEACERVAGLYAQASMPEAAERQRQRGAHFRTLEEKYLPRFDQVYVCQERDRDVVSRQYELANMAVAPNVIRLRNGEAARTGPRVPTLLFVGRFDYYPNVDAVTWFCEEILPIVRARLGTPFKLLLAGRRPKANVRRLAVFPEVSLVADAPSIERFYSLADVIVVPIRAGGGTRIKILEALSFGAAVVSTRFGADGLQVRHGEEIAIADTPEDFARECIDLLRDAAARAALGRRGATWIAHHHTLERLKPIILPDALPSPAASYCVDRLNFPTDALVLRDPQTAPAQP